MTSAEQRKGMQVRITIMLHSSIDSTNTPSIKR
jgi:hypothetical protein